MIENTEYWEMITNSAVVKLSLGTIITTLIAWSLKSIRDTNKKIKEAPTKEDLAKVKDDSFRYTDDRLKIHEDKQIIEIANMQGNIKETHRMVSELYAFHLKK